jgi:hypothetical protein
MSGSYDRSEEIKIAIMFDLIAIPIKLPLFQSQFSSLDVCPNSWKINIRTRGKR